MMHIGCRLTERHFACRLSPTPTLKPEGQYLQSAWQNGVYPTAKRMGTDIKLPTVSPQPYTAKTFEGYHFAAEHGKGFEWTDAVFKAFFQQDRGAICQVKVQSLAQCSTTRVSQALLSFLSLHRQDGCGLHRHVHWAVSQLWQLTLAGTSGSKRCSLRLLAALGWTRPPWSRR